MNPYNRAAKKIIDLCGEAITIHKIDPDDSVVNLFGIHLAQYARLREDVINVLIDFESEVRKPIPL